MSHSTIKEITRLLPLIMCSSLSGMILSISLREEPYWYWGIPITFGTMFFGYHFSTRKDLRQSNMKGNMIITATTIIILTAYFLSG
jgi:hypothetical protein